MALELVGSVEAFRGIYDTFAVYRFPFYWEIKTLVLLFLSLPQFEARAKNCYFFPKAALMASQGSTYIYKAYVEPYLVQNESEIDATIASARNETLQFLQLRLSALWDILYSLLNKTPIPSRGDSTNGSPLVDQNALFQSVQGLWGTISPVSFLAALAPGSGNPTDSRSASDTFESAKQAPSLSPPTAASATVGYDIGESRNN